MRITRRPLVVGLAAVAVIASSLSLSGCSIIANAATGGKAGGGVSIPGLSAGTGHLPKDWPSDVPVIKGDVISGAALGSGKDEVWNGTIKVSDGQQAADDIKSQLTGAGFTSQDDSSISSDTGSLATYTSSKWNVAIVITQDDNDKTWVANYTVTGVDNSNG
jgi:hypothetical protein